MPLSCQNNYVNLILTDFSLTLFNNYLLNIIQKRLAINYFDTELYEN